jgi:hypothetical protein
MVVNAQDEVSGETFVVLAKVNHDIESKARRTSAHHVCAQVK